VSRSIDTGPRPGVAEAINSLIPFIGTDELRFHPNRSAWLSNVISADETRPNRWSYRPRFRLMA
jgi:hypothetical protein